MIIDNRQQLLKIYHHALQAVNGRKSVTDYLSQHPFETPPAIIAIGKAAPAMMLGALEHLDGAAQHSLLITKQGLLTDNPLLANTICIESGHPVPNQYSLDAGKQLLAFIQNLPLDIPVLCLISGGASALVEVLPDNLDLTDLQRVNQYLLGSGLDIQHMNLIRQQLSCIKGGQLATYFHPQQTVVSLYISDVPNDDVSILGSGLLATPKPMDTQHKQDIEEIFKNLDLTVSVNTINQSTAHISHHIVASARIARLAALDMAQKLKLNPIYCADELLGGDILDAAEMIVQQLQNGAGLYLWSSETTVQLPETVGRGGRCQTLALAIAQKIAGNQQCFVLAGSTDGNDGSHFIAGALVDGETINRGETLGLDAADYLQRADAGSFLDMTGDLVDTGETGTNVMDLILAWRMSE